MVVTKGTPPARRRLGKCADEFHTLHEYGGTIRRTMPVLRPPPLSELASGALNLSSMQSGLVDSF
jgi:hypothetical protein